MRSASILIVAIAAAGCAALGERALTPGVSTEEQLRRAMGAPAVEFAHADGSRTLAYPSGPMGTQTYMADLAPNGTVRAVRPVLKEEVFQSVQPGMTRDEVLRLIGPPGDSMAFPRRRQVSWEYNFRDAWGYRALFFVDFDDRGIVVGKFTRRIDNDRSRDR